MGLSNLPAEIQEKLNTRVFIEQPHCLESVPEALARVNTAGLPALIIYDENTKGAAGQKTAEILTGAGVSWSELLLKPGGFPIVSPDYERVEEIRDIIRQRRAFPLAVGSGVINDLVKRAAFEAKTPYMCVGTASSMDGYCSFGAALVQGGFKITLPCDPPAAILADTDILKTAPYGMTASGYGDIYAKLASGVDWFLADKLGIEKIDPLSWDLVQRDLPLWVGSPEKLKAGDPAAFSGLFRGLTMSGIAMQVYRDSRPASGAEHLISHIWEMNRLSRPDGIPYSHGFKVAVGTVVSVSLMELFYNIRSLTVEACLKRRESWEERRASVWKLFPDPKTGGVIEEVCRAKFSDEKQLAARLEKLIPILPELKRFAAERLGSKEKVAADLTKAGCPVSVKELGLGKKDLVEAALKAQMIRRRYTVLDAVYETGLLPELLNRID